eukprot:scaffold19.g1831.t1
MVDYDVTMERPGIACHELTQVVQHLGTADRLALASCCKEVLEASRLHSGIWFGSLALNFGSRDGCDDERAASLWEWLARRRPDVRVLRIERRYGRPEGLPVHLPLKPLSCLQELKLELALVSAEQLEAVLGHTALTRLSLQQCGIQALPLAIRGLARLCSLSLQANLLRGGVEGLTALTALRELRLGRCGLGALPPGFPALAGLALLDLSHNEGLADVAPLCALHGLTWLNLRSCAFNALPDCFAGLTGLVRLALCADEWAADGLAPLAALSRLTWLSLAHHSTGALPAQVAALPQLRSLTLAGSFYAPGSYRHLAALEALTALDLSRCALRALPAAVERLAALRRLDLSNNRLEGTLHHLSALSLLTCLDMSSCGLSDLPPAFASLTALQELQLANNRGLVAARGWTRLSSMDQLTCLNLLHGVPCSISTLTALRSLRLGFNRQLSEEGVDALARLPALTYLCLDDCGCRDPPPAVGELARRGRLSLEMQ